MERPVRVVEGLRGYPEIRIAKYGKLLPIRIEFFKEKSKNNFTSQVDHMSDMPGNIKESAT
jgi:hypothetical protein